MGSSALWDRSKIAPFNLLCRLCQKRCLYSYSKRSPYDILGVKKDASQSDIKDAFYTMSKKFHPDVMNANSESAKKFFESKEAYDLLKDEGKRRIYDSSTLSGGFQQPYLHKGSYSRFRDSVKPGSFYDPSRAEKRRLKETQIIMIFGALFLSAIFGNYLFVRYMFGDASLSARIKNLNVSTANREIRSGSVRVKVLE